MSKYCPVCGGRSTHPSSLRPLEYLCYFLLLFRPYRCRECLARFWRFL